MRSLTPSRFLEAATVDFEVMQEEMPEAVRVRLVNILIERLALLRASYMLLVDSTF